jgi:hypothetical protein
MLELSLWLKTNGFRTDQVQAFLPSPMASATAMYHSGINPLKKVTRRSEEITVPKGLKIRRLHKAFLLYHDPENWPVLREALTKMNREDLIGNGKRHLVPAFQPGRGLRYGQKHRAAAQQTFRTQHTRSEGGDFASSQARSDRPASGRPKPGRRSKRLTKSRKT